jgi:uncharacterized protein VirK/YbjX
MTYGVMGYPADACGIPAAAATSKHQLHSFHSKKRILYKTRYSSSVAASTEDHYFD